MLADLLIVGVRALDAVPVELLGMNNSDETCAPTSDQEKKLSQISARAPFFLLDPAKNVPFLFFFVDSLGKSLTSGHCLEFPLIPTKLCDNLGEK